MFLVDNCSIHGIVPGLFSIQLEFLPASTTTLLEPMEKVQLRHLKYISRKSLLQRMLLSKEKEYKVVLRAVYPLMDASQS